MGGEAIVLDDAKIIDDAVVTDHATVFGASVVKNLATVREYATVCDSTLEDQAYVSGLSQLGLGVIFRGKTFAQVAVYGNIEIAGGVSVTANMKICFSLTETPLAVLTSDGYTMTLDKANGKISAGCRYFTFEEAIEHWKRTRGDTPLGKERLRQVEYLRRFM